MLSSENQLVNYLLKRLFYRTIKNFIVIDVRVLFFCHRRHTIETHLHR